MNKQQPFKKRVENKAFTRPQKKSERNNTSALDIEQVTKLPQSEFTHEELASSPWCNLANFCNDSYTIFIPQNERNQEKQESIVPIHKKCIDILSKESSNDWADIINQFELAEQRIAGNFFFHLSRKHTESPIEVKRNIKATLCKFIELAEYAFITTGSRDLVKLSEFSDVINYFNKSQERTFLFLSELPAALNENERNIILSSYGYREILNWGASRFLTEFGLQLQKRFRITHTAIKEEAAQNLVQELGETETNLRNQVEILKRENEELKKEREEISSQAFQEAVYQLAKTLQDQPQPVLDQIFIVQQRLNKISSSGENLSSESLSILIALETLLAAFQSLNIISFPTNINQEFELQSNDLGEYSYIEGSAFSNSTDQKLVRCIRPGWRVGEIIVTPARVKEIS